MKAGRNQNTTVLFENLGKQVIYQDKFQGNYSGSFTGSSQGNFSGTARGAFSGSASGDFTGSFSGYVSGALIFVPVTFAGVIHGVSVTASSPFSGPPIGFIPHSALSGANRLDIESVEFSSSSNGNYGLIVNYDLKHNEPRMFLTQTVNVNIPLSTNTAIGWGRSEIVGTALSWSGAPALSHSIQIMEPGDYKVDCTIGFPAGVTGSRRIFITKNNTVVSAGTRGLTSVDPSSGITAYLASSALMTNLIPGDTLQVFVFQSSGGVQSTDKAFNRCDVYRHRSHMVPTGSVSGILIRNCIRKLNNNGKLHNNTKYEHGYSDSSELKHDKKKQEHIY